MKLRYSTARESTSDAIRQRLETLGFELTEAAMAASGGADCDVFLLFVPAALDESIVMIREYRQLLAPALPLIVCGAWDDVESVGALLAAGADDYLPSSLETRQLGLRLQIFGQQAARRTAQADHAQLDAQLVRVQRLEMLASLTGSIAHDYNNLLSAIQGNAELALMDRNLDAPVRYSLEQINSAAHRAAEITRQILAFRGGAGSERMQPVNLSHLIREMGELLRVSVRRNCRFEYRLGRTLPLVAGDPLRLRHLVLAVVMHACGASGPGGGVIQISTDHEEGHDGARVVLAVRFVPAGPSGLPATLAGEDKTPGLAAILVLGRNQGAEISSGPDGDGVVYRVAIPVSVGHAAQSDGRGLAGEHVRPAGTILLIDDDEAMRVAAHRFLRRAGYTVFEAASGEEALALLPQVAPALDAVLVDLNMPGLECRDLLAQFRKIRGELRLVVWSGYPEDAARAQLAGLSGVAFIEKPAHLGELAAILQRVLGS